MKICTKINESFHRHQYLRDPAVANSAGANKTTSQRGIEFYRECRRQSRQAGGVIRKHRCLDKNFNI